MVAACRSAPAAPSTGFLSDYSRLDTEVADGRIHVASEARVAAYRKILFDHVEVFPPVAPGSVEDASRAELRAYTRDAFVQAVRRATGRYAMTRAAGPGVARLRIAVVDIESLGRGEAALELELVDSQTGEQLAAATLSQARGLLSGGQKGVIDDWARRFQERLLEAYER
jgi:hypothetical protein